MFVITTKPGRAVRRSKNAVQKYAQVRSNGTFKWVTNANEATVFPTASAMIHALGIRAQNVDKITKDVSFGEAQQSGVSVSRIYNGGQ